MFPYLIYRIKAVVGYLHLYHLECGRGVVCGRGGGLGRRGRRWNRHRSPSGPRSLSWTPHSRFELHNGKSRIAFAPTPLLYLKRSRRPIVALIFMVVIRHKKKDIRNYSFWIIIPTFEETEFLSSGYVFFLIIIRRFLLSSLNVYQKQLIIYQS